MIDRLSLLIVLSLSGLSYSSVRFCDSQSFDSVFNFGHLIHFLRCGEVWTYDPRMNGGAGGFLRDWSLLHLATQKLDTEDRVKMKDFRFSAFSFQELNCFNYDDDLSDSCYSSVKEWDHLSVLFTETRAVIFKYRTEFEAIHNSDNPLGVNPIEDISNENPNHHFWPRNRTKDSRDKRQFEKYLSALYDPNKEVLFIGYKTSAVVLITYTHLKEPIHDYNKSPKKDNTFNSTWATPFAFEGHLIGMFFDENKNKSYIVGEVLRNNRQWNDNVYEMEVGNGTMVNIKDPVSYGKTTETVRTYFGCKYSENELDHMKRVKRSSKVRQKRCVSMFDEDEEQVVNDSDFLTRVSNDPRVLISLSILIVILSSLLFFLYLDSYPKP